MFARNRAIKNKELLFVGRPSPTPSSGSSMNLAHAESNFSSEVPAAKGGLSEEHSLSHSLSHDRNNVNNSNTTRISRDNNTFVSPQDIERFDQRVYQGTGHIILDNSFNLRYIGMGEGTHSYGWGLYFAQKLAVAKNYRRYGLPLDKQGGLTITTKDGKKFTRQNDFRWSGSPDLALETVLDDIAKETRKNPQANIDQILQLLQSQYKKEQGPFAPSERLANKYNALDKISSFSLNQSSNGNVYIADIPENDVLLDWDSDTQPEKVQHAIQKVISRLYNMGVYEDDVEIVANSKTGQEFYNNLRDALEPFIDDDTLPFDFQGKPITRSDMAASLLLNQAGIPGLRYFDSGSRDAKSGTRNFVIWNTDMIKLLGLSRDSDNDAKQYFREQKAKSLSNPDIYKQTANSERNNAQQLEADNLEWTLRIYRKQLETVRRLYQGTDKWMKAPNGQPTNLTEKQWLQVRTPNFKRWFGDWEKHPEHASKAIDKNGEPLVVYRGTPKGDTINPDGSRSGSVK